MASQGTMNNFTFGNASYQYYETIWVGFGADFDGWDVQTHMTNSRLTDPEVLEWRFPLPGLWHAPNSGNGHHHGGCHPSPSFLRTMTAAILSGRSSLDYRVGRQLWGGIRLSTVVE